MTHWLNSYIGKPYRLGSSGSGAFGCWSFVQWVLAHHYGHTNTELEEWGGLNNSSSTRWMPLHHPLDGAVVMMEAANCPHVGIWVEIDQGGVAHCIERFGVIFTSLSTLSLLGCRVIGFYRFSQSSQ